MRLLFALACCATSSWAFQAASPLPSRVAAARPTATAVLMSSADRASDNYGETAQVAAGVLGIISNPIMDYSLFVLKTTGCGLPAGPFGLLGAAEGVSYLVVIGYVASALVQKVRTGSGLPAGPFGLIGAAEGLSFLTFVAGLVVLGFQLTDYGYVPEAVPTVGGVCSNI